MIYTLTVYVVEIYNMIFVDTADENGKLQHYSTQPQHLNIIHTLRKDRKMSKMCLNKLHLILEI